MKTFLCASCGLESISDTTEEEALEEMRKHFGSNIPTNDLVSVCEACYAKMNPENYPHLVETVVDEYLRERNG